jgi:chromosome segregation ATPase
MQPNLRALERYDDVSRRVKESSDAYEQAKNAAQQANAHFAQLRQQRKVLRRHREKERKRA